MKTMKNLERFASWIDMIAAAVLLTVCISEVWILWSGIGGDWELLYSDSLLANIWRDKVYEFSITALKHVAVAWIGYLPFNMFYKVIHRRVLDNEERV